MNLATWCTIQKNDCGQEAAFERSPGHPLCLAQKRLVLSVLTLYTARTC